LSLILTLLAGCFGAAVNFCLRRNFKYQQSANGYLALYFVFSFLISFAFRFEVDFSSFSPVMGSIGVFAGILNLLMMLLVAKALKSGPSGLTFAFQNSSSIFPAIFLFFLFGTSFGFTLHPTLIIGCCCLILGLFISAKKKPLSGEAPRSARWLFFSCAHFFNTRDCSLYFSVESSSFRICSKKPRLDSMEFFCSRRYVVSAWIFFNSSSCPNGSFLHIRA